MPAGRNRGVVKIAISVRFRVGVPGRSETWAFLVDPMTATLRYFAPEFVS